MLYRLSVSLWAGGNAIFTLLLTPILFKTESRDTAARIVGNFFQAYFKWGLACGLWVGRSAHPPAETAWAMSVLKGAWAGMPTLPGLSLGRFAGRSSRRRCCS
jgi:hypothetical protein